MSKLELSECERNKMISKLIFSVRFEEHQNLNFLKQLSFQIAMFRIIVSFHMLFKELVTGI
jgi:hypothetical protein